MTGSTLWTVCVTVCVTVFWLFLYCSSVIAPGGSKTIGPKTFKNWGSHSDHLPFSYMTAAAAVGMTSDDVSVFLTRLDKTLSKWRKKFPAPSVVGDAEKGVAVSGVDGDDLTGDQLQSGIAACSEDRA